MFSHIFIYRLKMLFKNKSLIFWTMIFPIALATFFSLAFGNLNEQGRFQAIDVAVVETLPNHSFMDVINDLSHGEDRLFNLKITDERSANQLLSDGEVQGYILVDENPKLIVNESGMRQSILKIFLDQYIQTSSAINNIVSENPDSVSQISAQIMKRVSFTEEEPISDEKIDIVLTFFYSLIAMTTFYGGFFGLETIVHIQGNLSANAVRQNISPVHKLKLFMYSFFAALLVQLIEMGVFLSYLAFVLGVDFSSNFNYILLTVVLGSITGVSLGAFMGALSRGNIDIKYGYLIAFTTFGSFLSGMMVVNMKYIVTTRFPLLAWINPINLLADAFYSLYYFGPTLRYFQNIIGLLIFSTIFCTGTYLVIRRQKYASI